MAAMSDSGSMRAVVMEGQGDLGTLCSIEIEMSGLVEIEMSSFGVCSFEVERTNGTGGGDADIEPARSRSTGSAEASGAGVGGGPSGGGAPGSNATPFPQAA